MFAHFVRVTERPSIMSSEVVPSGTYANVDEVALWLREQGEPDLADALLELDEAPLFTEGPDG